MTSRVFIISMIVGGVIGCTTVKQEQEGRQESQEVLGTMVIGFSPTVLASLPEPPINLMLHIRPSAGGRDVIHNIADGTAIWEVSKVNCCAGRPTSSGDGGQAVVGASYQNFRLTLPPGDYFITGFDVRAPSLLEKPFFLPTGGPSFTVPKANCVYIGRIGAIYSRLPPGSLDQAKQASANVSLAMGGRTVSMIYLQKGALVAAANSLDQPMEDEHTPAGMYSKQLLAYAHQRKCAVQLAKFQVPPHRD